METLLSINRSNERRNRAVSLSSDGVIAVALFLAALLPRLAGLGKFITGDEPRWVVRSISFLTALLEADWGSTLQTGHPGVTTMWSGSLGLVLDYALNHRSAGSLLAFLQSLPHDPQRIDPTILPWMRLPAVLLTALCIVALFWLLRSLDRNIALLAALLLAFHPLYLGHSQLLHHDALVSVFTAIAILLLLMSLRSWSWRWMIVSGVMVGLAVLSKSTGYALIPFAGLALGFAVLRRRVTLDRAVLGGLAWSLAAAITVVALWPAIWLAPGQVWRTVFGWATDSADVGSVATTLMPDFSARFPDLGLLFYPINWLLKSTPLMLLGLLFWPVGWRKESPPDSHRWWAGQLLLWIGLFSLMLTLGDKRDGRYLLPIYFALSILAAFGLQTLYHRLKSARPLPLRFGSLSTDVYQVVFAGLLLGFSLAYYPYYPAYYNPLIGGPWLAPRLVKVGLGEGMEQAAAWLNAQPNADRLRIAADLEQTFWPYFAGQVVDPNTEQTFSADYVLNYTRQIQNGVPFPEYWQYYAARQPDYQLRIAGIDYLWLHKAPPLASVGRIPFGDDLTLRAFTTDRPLAEPGAALNVTLVWRTGSPSAAPVRLQLRDGAGQVWAESAPAPVNDPTGPSTVEGHYRLPIPPDVPRGGYRLWATVGENADWVEIAPIPAGRTSPPGPISNPVEANFAGQIALRGFDLSSRTPAPGELLQLDLHWQALQPVPHSYTTFVHVIDSAGNVVAQSDVLPGQGQWLTNTWQAGEWITDGVGLSLPAQIPAGTYRILAGWYHLETGQRLPLLDDDSGQNAVVLGEITVQ